jgi:hypothetical protein
MLTFGITLKPDMTPQRVVALARQAEAAGFTYGWLFDSHVLWLEPYPLLTLMAQGTKRMRLGACVTNPAVRDPTVTASAWSSALDAAIARGVSWASARLHWPISKRRRRPSARWQRASLSKSRANRFK